VTGIASQPFRLWWTAQGGKTPLHVPDYFAERAGGPALVVDCRPRGPPSSPGPGRVRGNSLGMRPGRVGVPAGRRPGPGCHGEPAVAGRVPAPAVRHTGAGRDAAGRVRRSCPAGDPIAVLLVLYHLLWRQELAADLSVGSGVSPGRASIASAGKPPLAGARAGISYGCCPDLIPGRGAPPLPVVGPVHPGRWTVLAAARACLRLIENNLGSG
jgi:hypothetical protein